MLIATYSFLRYFYGFLNAPRLVSVSSVELVGFVLGEAFPHGGDDEERTAETDCTRETTTIERSDTPFLIKHWRRGRGRGVLHALKVRLVDSFCCVCRMCKQGRECACDARSDQCIPKVSFLSPRHLFKPITQDWSQSKIACCVDSFPKCACRQSTPDTSQTMGTIDRLECLQRSKRAFLLMDHRQVHR